MPSITRSSVAALAVSILTVVAGTWLVINGVAPTSSKTKVAAAQVTPPPVPTPIPVPPIAVAQHPSSECPQMDNPGGRLDWQPSDNPGPTPTNGRVKLPAIGVDAPIVRVGIDADNKMVVPHNARDVAWLDRGGIPGYTNNIVLAGHIAYSRVPGSFGRIGELRPGDDIVLQVESKQLHYRVVWNCLFGRNTDRAEQIMGYTNVPSVTLISCGGGWDASAGTHTSRYAIRAEQVGPSTPKPAEPGFGAETATTSEPTPSPTAAGLLGHLHR